MLDYYMSKAGFTQSTADPCVFVRIGKELAIVGVYVNDLIFITETGEEMLKIKRNLIDTFQMRDMGKLHRILWISIIQRNGYACLHQRNYIERVLKKYGMDECKPVATPADMNVKLLKDDGVSNEVDCTVYQAMVGSLLYAAIAIYMRHY